MSDRKPIPGKFVWFELETNQKKKAQAFYAELLGWKVLPFAMGPDTYEMIQAGETPDTMIGGYAHGRGANAPSAWTAYVSVPDVDAAARAASAAGGKVLMQPEDIPTVGRFARIEDPQGAIVHLFKGDQGDPPDGDVPAGRFFWNELHTTDPARALAFYEKVVGWTHSTMGDYIILNSGGGGRGGISGHLPPKRAPHWLPYIHVDDVDATATRAQKHGAQIRNPPEDIPEVGRYAVIEDPTGGLFAVMKPRPRVK